MDRDHIVRIILEGKNNFGNVVRDMARQADVEFRRIRNNWTQMDVNAARFNRTVKEGVQNVRQFGTVLGALRQRADAASGSFARMRREAAAAIRESKNQKGGLGDLFGGFQSGRRIARETRDQIREAISLSKEEFEAKKQILKDHHAFEREQLNRFLFEENEKKFKAINDFLQQKKTLEKNARDDIAAAEDKEQKAQIRQELKDAKVAIDEQIRLEREKFRRLRAEKKESQRQQFSEETSALLAPDEAGITRKILAARREIQATDNAARRLGQTVGVAMGDMSRGFSDGRRGLRALTIEGQRADSIFARLGNTIGRATRSFGTLVNLRWFILISALQLFGSLVATIGANLVSLASSATLAGAALGGAFAAALGQGIAIMGLFRAAASRLGEVMDAVKLQEQERLRAGDDAVERANAQRTAVQQLADANWSLKLALEGVGDANTAVREAEEERIDAIRNQRRAVVDLAEARREAARDIVDANLDEREAALSLEEAELAVLEAKRRLREEETKKVADKTDLEDAKLAVQEANERLRIARAEGDQVEIGSALSGVAIAEQNLARIRDSIDSAETDLKQAQLAVERAEVNRKQAQVRNVRAQENAEELRKKGVEGSDRVVSAQDGLRQATERVADATDRIAKAERGVRDAIHAVAIARRNQADAERGVNEALTDQSAAQKDLQNRLADMSGAERKLFESIVRIRKIYKDNFGPITDIIIGSYQRAVDRAAILLQDPKILNAAKRLARAIADAVDTISKFALTPEFRNALTKFLDEATKNVPLLTRAFLALLRVFLRLGTAGAPLFRNVLERFVGLVERLEKATRDPERLERFFGGARRHLDAWLELGKAIGAVAAVLVPQAAGAATGPEAKGPPAPGKTTVPPGPGAKAQGLLPFFTEKLRDAEKFFKENPESVTKFFNNMSEALQNLAPILGRTIALLFEAFSSEEAQAFTRVVLEVVIPGLAGLIKVLGELSKILLFILDIPIIGDIVKFALSFLVFEKALNKIFPVTQKLTNGVKLLAGTIGRALVSAVKNASLRPLALLFDGARLRAMYFWQTLKDVGSGLKTMAARALEAGKNVSTRLVTGLKDAAIRSLELSKNALHAARVGLASLLATARTTAGVLAGRLAAAFRGVITLIRVGLVNALRLLRTNIRLLLLSTGIGALIVAGVLLIEHWDKVKKFAKILADVLLRSFGRVVDWVKKNWKTIATIIVGIFTFPVGVIAIAIFKFKDKFIGVFQSIVTAIKDLFIGLFKWVKEKITGIGDFVVGKATGVVNKVKSLNPFGGDGKSDEEKDREADAANRVLELPRFDKQRRRIKKLRAEGKTGLEILDILVEEGLIPEDVVNRLKARQSFAKGGEVQGFSIGGAIGGAISGIGQAVPIIAHAGEWVVNKVQQQKLVNRLNMTADEIKSWLFDAPTGQGKAPKKGRTAQSHRGNHFTLSEQIDDDGNSVWFIEMDDGAWGQISRRSAQRIKATNGAWIPPHVLRSTHGFTKRPLRTGALGGIAAMARGGVVQSFALGGVVGEARDFAQGAAITIRPGQTQGNKTVSQEFNVRAEGTMDWNYIMRLGAMRAQEV